jgi:hypothetical protein
MRHINQTSLLRRIIAIVLLTFAPLGFALADSYIITLFSTSGGTGGFGFTNTGSTGCFDTSSPSVTAGTLPLFNSANGFCVEVAEVDFNDGKTDAKYGANQITGNYVEGLSGELQNADGNVITFTFAGSGGDPSSFTRTYQIEDASGGEIIDSGTYAVVNQASSASVPEPNILALIATGLSVLGFATYRKRIPASEN